MQLGSFFGVAARVPSEHALPGLRIVPGRYEPPGTVWLEVDAFLAAGLAARGLPARFRARPTQMSFDLPPGEPLVTVEDGWGPRTIACRTESGEVAIGFDPDLAIARTLAEVGRPGSGDASAPRAASVAPWASAWGRLCARFTGQGGAVGWSRSHDENVDALRFACWLLSEEAYGRDGEEPPSPPTPFWPSGARLAFTLVHEALEPTDLVRLRRLRDALGRGRTACTLGPAIYRRDPKGARHLAVEGVDVGIYDPHGDPRAAAIAKDLVPEAELYRVAPARRSQRALAGLGANFRVDVSIPQDDGSGGGAGTAFPFVSASGAVHLPETLPSDTTLLRGGASPQEALALWWERVEALRRVGGMATLVVRTDAAHTGGNAGLQRAVAALCAELEDDPEVWVASPADVAAHWQERLRAPSAEPAPALAR